MSVDLLLVGPTGRIGACLLEHVLVKGVTCVALSHAQLDVSDEAKLSACLSMYKPKCVINAVAYTKVDEAESDTVAVHTANVQGALNLAKCAQAVDAVLIHLSTDYVFDGLKAGCYRESDQPNPLSAYGRSKLLSELAIEEHCHRYLIVRTGWVFGKHGSNFVKTMLKLASQRTILNVVSDQVGGPTYASDIASTLLEMMQQALTPQFSKWGIYHYAGTPYISWFEFALEIFSRAVQQGLLTHIPELKPISSVEYASVAKRPINSRLDCTKINSVFNIPPCDWKSAMADLSPYISQ